MHITHKGVDGKTPLLIIQPFCDTALDLDPYVLSLVDELKRIGYGFVYMSVMPEPRQGQMPVVDVKFLAQYRDPR